MTVANFRPQFYAARERLAEAISRGTLLRMTPKSVTFTANGRVVVPAALRRQLGIKPGTRATLTVTPDGILLRPITRASIHKLMGKYAASGPTTADLEAERRADCAREERHLSPKA